MAGMNDLNEGRIFSDYNFLAEAFSRDPDDYVEPDMNNLTHNYTHPEMNR